MIDYQYCQFNLKIWNSEDGIINTNEIFKWNQRKWAKPLELDFAYAQLNNCLALTNQLPDNGIFSVDSFRHFVQVKKYLTKMGLKA